MKIGSLNLTKKFQKLNILSSPPRYGGSRRVKFLNASVFFLIAVFGFLETLEKSSIESAIIFSIPFLFLFAINILLSSEYTDIISNVALSVGAIIATPYGNLTAAVFIILSIYVIRNKYHYYILSTIIIISIIISSEYQGVSVFQVSVILIGYIFLISKYIETIHFPTIRMRKKIQDLENRLFILGGKDPLSNDQILHKYPFMKHSGDDPYRKIRDLRLLANDKIYKEIAAINGITEQNQSREFNNMKKNFSSELNRPVETQISLIKAGIELGIIKIDYRHQ